MSKKNKRIEDRQLCRYLKLISREESDIYQRQELLAYSILLNLANAQITTNSFEESRFQEIKQVYTGLENVISQYKQGINPMQEFYKLVDTVNWKDFPEDATSKDLLIERIYTEHISDHPKRLPNYLNDVGFKLLSDLGDVSPYRGKRTAMTKDYATIEKAFDLQVTQW